MIRISIFIFLMGILHMFQSCQGTSKEQKIIDRAIDAHGGENYKKAKISFDFRNIHYQILKTPSRYEYSREFTDSLGNVRDQLNNQGFVRTINGRKVNLPEERIKAFSNSVNSVAYFALLPYGLNDDAVRKKWLGESELEGNRYDIVFVNFSENGGGEDFDDEFLYWINKETGRMDYMAYTYETDGGGVRFRKAIHPKIINGILLQDYLNFKPEDKNTPLEEMEELYKNGKLELLSEIQLENIEVEMVDE
jgi:hypothetical protein